MEIALFGSNVIFRFSSDEAHTQAEHMSELDRLDQKYIKAARRAATARHLGNGFSIEVYKKLNWEGVGW